MMRTENILIVCRSLDEIRLLSHIKIDEENKYIIASDDTRVHKAVEKYPWVNKVYFVEKMESFYNVAEDVIRFLEIINKWLESLGDDQHGIPKELLFWIRHAEGGMTTQRIQDLLLLIRSYLQLIDNYEISRIITLAHHNTYWEDSVLTQTARSRGVDVQVIGRFRTNVLMGRVVDFLKTIAREPYYFLNIFWTKISSQLIFTRYDSYEKEIVIQLCGSEPKHLEQYVPLMKAIEKKSYNPVALCWGAHSGANQIRREYLRAEELEKWLPIPTILISLYKVFKSWRNAVARRKDLLSDPNLQYQDVSISGLLWPSVNFFFVAELAQRYRLMIASKKYFERHFPLAIKFWTLIFPEAIIPFIHLKKKGGKNPLIFHWPSPLYAPENPYEHQIIPVDLVLAANTKQKILLAKIGFPPSKIISVGRGYQDNIVNFQKKYSQDQSRSYLKISSAYSTYVLYDSGCILRGYHASSEEVRITEFLLDFAEKHPSIALIIKPHPSHHPGILESQIESHSLQNVFLINNKMLPHHCLNASDLIITKFSTIGIKAMYFKRPVISVILDNEKRFKLFGYAAEYVHTIQELDNLLSKIINDEDYRYYWSLKQKEKVEIFLNELTFRTSKSSFELAADAIDALIKEKEI